MRSALKPLVLLLACLAPLQLPANDSRISRFYGYAFDLASDRYLYTEVHEQTFVDGQWTRGTIRYYAPDGTLWGEKTLAFGANRYIPEFDYALPALGYREGITEVGDEVVMRRERDGRTRTERVALEAPMAGDSGFHNFILDHFDVLEAGEPVSFRFVAAGKLDTFRFRARRVEDGAFEGRRMIRLRVEADSLLRLVAPDLTVSYDPETRHLKEYRGPSNVINPATGDVFETRIAYYSEPPAAAPKTLPPLEPAAP